LINCKQNTEIGKKEEKPAAHILNIHRNKHRKTEQNKNEESRRKE
jgi:hypothetical protein